MEFNFKEHNQDMKERVLANRTFMEQQFNIITIQLLASKYGYYVKSISFMDDSTYDFIEKGWYSLGLALGYLKEDETSPCIDFDEKHPLAGISIEYFEWVTAKRCIEPFNYG